MARLWHTVGRDTNWAKNLENNLAYFSNVAFCNLSISLLDIYLIEILTHRHQDTVHRNVCSSTVHDIHKPKIIQMAINIRDNKYTIDKFMYWNTIQQWKWTTIIYNTVVESFKYNIVQKTQVLFHLYCYENCLSIYKYLLKL